jgi:hypothetical protein
MAIEDRVCDKSLGRQKHTRLEVEPILIPLLLPYSSGSVIGAQGKKKAEKALRLNGG